MQQRQTYREDSATLAQSITILQKHRYAVFASSLLLAVIGVMVVSLIPSQYQATTTILVDPQKIPERYVASTVTSDPNAHLNTLTQQVLSASRLQEIVDQLNMYPELRKKKSREELLEYIRSKIKIELKPGAEQSLSSFSISYIDRQRDLVAPVANQLAASFIEWNLKSRQQQALVTTQFLSHELQQAQESLEAQESALEAFRMQHAGATPDQLNANLQVLSRLQTDVQANIDSISRLDQERILMSQQQPGDMRDSHDSTPTGERGRLIQERNRLELELQNLRRQFTETYPDVQTAKRQLENVESRLSALPPPTSTPLTPSDPGAKLRVELINKDIDRHQQQLANLQRQIAGYQQKVQSVPVLETRLAELTRNYETSRQNYQSLLDKRLSAGMSEDLERRQQAERFTVLDSARTPDKPAKPKRLPLMAGAIALGLLLPGALTVVIGLRSGTLKSETELMAMLPARIKMMATIPPISNQHDLRRARRVPLQTAIFSAFVVASLVIFLLKVRPTL